MIKELVRLSEEDCRKYAFSVLVDLEDWHDLGVTNKAEGLIRDLEEFRPEVLPLIARNMSTDLFIWAMEVSPAAGEILSKYLSD
jgi:hypothetical protein